MTSKIGLISLGCAKNRVNSEQMLYLLREAGYEIQSGDDAALETYEADAVVVNTCGFIESAKTEAIDTILELAEAKKSGRIKKIIVVGCLAERYRDEILSELPEIDAILGVGSYGEIAAAVKSALEGKAYAGFGDKNAPEPETKRIISTSQAWAYLKIAEGCDNRCAYCVIPDIRGRFRSRPLENVVQEARELAQRGVRELIVVAQDTTRYGLDLYGRRRLPELLEQLVKIDDLRWIRLHYLYPYEVDDRLVDVIAGNEKILNYLDIPIQHISDTVLRKMGRRGSGAEIRALLDNLREKIPGLVLRTSLITGLPGEGEAEFKELYDFLKEARIERAGVFAYSPEEGTPASLMEYPDHETACQRAEALMALQSEIMDRFNESRIGTVTTVLAEGYDGAHYVGRSFAESPEIDGMIRFTGKGIRPGAFYEVEIKGTYDGEPLGSVTGNHPTRQ
jgi:ribosomal protein S12 methylthiotransferase